MRVPARPVFQSLVEQAVAATGAASGWLLARDQTGLSVMAIAGPAADPGVVQAAHVPVAGARAYALSSGQAAALMPQPGDAASCGAAGYPGVPVSLLTVPCPTWFTGPATTPAYG
ncbi:MAG: hypothetical protein R2761_31180 [Acidimicrobiales bacterium]